MALGSSRDDVLSLSNVGVVALGEKGLVVEDEETVEGSIRIVGGNLEGLV